MSANKEPITIERLTNELQVLKSAHEMPRMYLVDYIGRLTNKVDIAFQECLNELDDKKSKESIEACISSHMEIVERIESFEKECLQFAN